MRTNMGDSYGGEGQSVEPSNYENVVIFLHGLGDTAAGWASVIPFFHQKLGDQVFNKTKFVLPTAPIRAVTVNHGMPMPAWSDIKEINPNAPEDEIGFKESAARVHRMIAFEKNKGIDPRRIIIGGFSQGGATTYLALLSGSDRLGGFIGLSAWVPFALQKPQMYANIHPDVLKTRVFHGHGTADGIVNHRWGAASAETLRSMGFVVSFQSYENMDHATCPRELDDVAIFVADVLGAKA